MAKALYLKYLKYKIVEIQAMLQASAVLNLQNSAVNQVGFPSTTHQNIKIYKSTF